MQTHIISSRAIWCFSKVKTSN